MRRLTFGMPPKAQPRPKPPPQRSQGASQANDKGQAPSAPSPKAQIEDVDEMRDDSLSTEPARGPDPQLSRPEPTNATQSTTTTTASSPPPPRRPRQRLASALPRNSSSTASLANPDGETRPAALKYKPKSAMRKSKEEREIAAKAEIERQAARQASEAKANGSERGGYYAWGRGRGGFGDMGRGKDQRFNMSHGATGHLGGSTLGEATRGRRGRGGYGGGSGGGGGGGGRGGGGGGGEGGEGGGVEEEAGRGPGGDGGGGHTRASDSTSTRVKKEPTVKGEKEKDGDVVMGSSMAKSKPKRTKIKREDQAPTYVSSDEEFDSDGKERMDIERINLVTDDEGSNDQSNPVSEIAKGKKRERLSQPRLDLLRPVRIQRQEHVERAVGVDTNASSLTSAELRRRAKERNEGGGSLFLPEEEDAEILYSQKVKGRRKTKDVEFLKDERKWKGVYQDEDDKDSIVKIKDEPQDEGDVMLVDKPLQTEGPERMAVDEGETLHLSGAIQNTLPDISGSVPQHTQDIDETAREIADIENTHPNMQDENHQQPDVERPQAGLYHKAYRPPTREEIEIAKAELSAETDEIDAILAEIESQTSTSESLPTAKSDNTNDPVDLSHEANAILPIIEGANYIFQLPPLLPSLRDASKKPPPPEKVPNPKPKPTLLPTPDPPKPSTKTTTTTNPFASTTIKEEQDKDIKPDPDALGPAPSIPHTYISGGIYHPIGHVGSFRVHRGGKLSASWGGMGMEVGRGGGGKVDTLQELVVTEFGSEVVKREDAEGIGGVWEEKVRVGERVWALGMTRPGFVAVPGLGGVLS